MTYKDREKYLEMRKRYREKHKEQIKEEYKNYWAENKEKIQARRSEKFECFCGGHYTREKKKKHEHSIKHQSYIQKNSLV